MKWLVIFAVDELLAEQGEWQVRGARIRLKNEDSM